MDRIILHVDMDAFFAQLEERENPQFKAKPIIVGSDPKEGKGRGVVSTANYEARKYGIHSALAISKAWKLCPQAVFLPVNMHLYERVSFEIMEIIKSYSDLFEITSLDEGYLDLSSLDYDEAEKTGKRLRKEILLKEKLTCTVGIGPNKMIAKLATNSVKPNGLKVVRPKEVESFLKNLEVDDIPGVGPKTNKKMFDLGIVTVSDLKEIPLEALMTEFGIVGEDLFLKARGIDNSPVEMNREAKSISKAFTFEMDTRSSEEILHVFENLCKEVFLSAKDIPFKTITVTCRFKGFKTHTKAKTFKNGIISEKEFLKESKMLLLKFLVSDFRPLRLVGVRVSGF